MRSIFELIVRTKSYNYLFQEQKILDVRFLFCEYLLSFPRAIHKNRTPVHVFPKLSGSELENKSEPVNRGFKVGHVIHVQDSPFIAASFKPALACKPRKTLLHTLSVKQTEK